MAHLLKLGTRIEFVSPVNEGVFRGVICGYPALEDTYEVKHQGFVYLMKTDEFTVIDEPDTLLPRLWHSSTDLLDRFGAHPSVKQASDRMLSEVLELVIAAHDPYGTSTDEIAAEAVDMIVTAINVLRACHVTQDQFMNAMEKIIRKNDAKTLESHQLNVQTQGVEKKVSVGS